MEFERRYTAELRAAGRRLSGTVMKYGTISPSHRERFEPGALRLAESVHLDLFHDPERAIAWHPGGGLTLANGRDALTMRAELPPLPAGDRALAEIKAGRVDGLSVEFRAVKESRIDGIRVVQEAILSGIAIVKAPSYGGSRVEARRRSGRTIRARVPSDTDLACTCSGAGCKFARFAKEALEDVFERTFQQFERETVAAYGSYASPLASVGRGTLRGKMVDDALEVEIDVPAGAAGDAVIAANEDAGIVVRPFLDADRSEGTPMPREDGQNAMAYTKASVRAFIVSSTDEREGWPVPELVATPGELASASAPRLRGLPRWL